MDSESEDQNFNSIFLDIISDLHIKGKLHKACSNGKS